MTLRRDDLRAWTALDTYEGDIDKSTMTRPVSDVEVLEALGAERKWVCWALNGPRCTGPSPEGRPVPRTHGGCGWRWVVTDE